MSISELKQKNNRTKKTQATHQQKKKADKTPTEINPDLMRRPELQKKKFIHPSATHESLNTDFNNRYINNFLQRVSEHFINNVPTHIPSMSYQLNENQQLISFESQKSVRIFQTKPTKN